MTSPPPLRAAIVGAGLMGRWHADAVFRSGHKVTLIVEPDVRRAHSLSRRFPEARVVHELNDELCAGAADVAHVCTPLAEHESCAELAIGAGMHVIVEKPATASSPATERLLAQASARGLLLIPVHQFGFQPGVLALQQALLQSGELLHLDLVACTAGAEGLDSATRDRLCVDILPHAFGLVRRIGGTDVSAVPWDVLHTRPGEMRITGAAGQVMVNILLSTSGRPTTNSLRAITSAATFDVNLFHGYSVRLAGRPTRAFKMLHPFVVSARTTAAAGGNLLARSARGERAYPGLRELVGRFYAAVRDGAEPPITAVETIDVARARDHVIATIAGSRQTV